MIDSYQEELGKRLKIARNHLGLSQEELADKMSVSRWTVMKYESGKKPLPNAFAFELEHYFRINSTWLLTGEEEMILPHTQKAFRTKSTPDNFSLIEMVQKTTEILESDTIYRTALASNVNAFHQALRQQAEVKELRSQLEGMQERLAAMETRMNGFELKGPGSSGSKGSAPRRDSTTKKSSLSTRETD